MALLYKADPARGAEWKELIAEKVPGLAFHIWPDTGDPALVRYLAVWEPPDDMMVRFPRAEIVFSTGAGVDQFDLSAFPSHIPLVRMMDPGIVDSMVEYVTMAVLALHRDLPRYVKDKENRCWNQVRIVPAGKRRVGVMGLGRLGEAVCRRLLQFGFPVAGWNRSQRAIDAVACYAGAAALPEFLARCDILVCLLPLTSETRAILDAQLFSRLPRGSSLVNVARGGHLVQTDLLAALESGQIAAAFLDVTDPEPLPHDHPLWTHPHVMITPHIASMTRPDAAVDFVLETIKRHKAGLPLEGLVDRLRGY